MKKFLVALFVVLAATIMVHGMADAKVTGECVNCHTMHNSQDGSPMAVSNGSWDGNPNVDGDPKEEPYAHLLRAGCIGCHSSTSSSTTVSMGSTTIPIVRSTFNPAGTYLAGGNFYYSDNDDAKGHNISTNDGTLLEGPGLDDTHDGVFSGHGCGNCHVDLIDGAASRGRESCEACHYVTFHHGEPGPYNATSTATDPTYRFLTGHHYFPSSHSDGNGYVEGVEDDDWEADSSGHNYYKGWDQDAALNSDDAWHETRVEHTLSSFCSNCHNLFHNQDGTGSGTWLRHPVDQELPTTGEFSGYSYSMETPVAYSTLPSTPAGGDEAGPVVACVSCHRTHASEYDDMLRFDYSSILAGMGGSGGCFNCHADKN
jgi:hypothetical protein